MICVCIYRKPGSFPRRGVLKDKQISKTDVNEQISLRVVPLDMPQHVPVPPTIHSRSHLYYFRNNCKFLINYTALKANMQVKYTSTRILMVTSSLKISHWCVFLTDKMSIFRTHCQIIQTDSFHQYSHLVKHSTELPPHTTNGRLVGVTHCLLVCCSVWSDLPWEQLATGISSPLSCGTKHLCIKTRPKTAK